MVGGCCWRKVLYVKGLVPSGDATAIFSMAGAVYVCMWHIMHLDGVCGNSGGNTVSTHEMAGPCKIIRRKSVLWWWYN